ARGRGGGWVGTRLSGLFACARGWSPIWRVFTALSGRRSPHAKVRSPAEVERVGESESGSSRHFGLTKKVSAGGPPLTFSPVLQILAGIEKNWPFEAWSFGEECDEDFTQNASEKFRCCRDCTQPRLAFRPGPS